MTINIKAGGKTIKTTVEELEDAADHVRNLPAQANALGQLVKRYREIMRERKELLEPIKRDLEELKIDCESAGSAMGIIKAAAKSLDIIEEKGLPHYHACMAQYGNALDALGTESGIQLDLFGRFVSGAQKEAREANKASKSFGDTKGNA